MGAAHRRRKPTQPPRWRLLEAVYDEASLLLDPHP